MTDTRPGAEPVSSTTRVGDPPPPWRAHIPALDGLRGVAVLLVMLLHFQLDSPDTELGRVYASVVDSGWAGVDLFFVLSGFLITGILYDSRNSGGYFRNFYARRTLRIFPLYFAFLFLRFVVAPRFLEPSWVELDAPLSQQAWAWLYMTNLQISLLGAGSEAPFTGHFWSLAIEEQFYLVWPAVVLLVPRRRLIALCCGIMAGALALRMVFVFAWDNYAASYYFTPARMDALALGALLALVVRGPEGIAPLLRWRRPVLWLCGALLVVLYLRRGLWWQDVVVGTVGFTIVALFFGAVLVTAVAARPGSLQARSFAHPVLCFFGRYSYAIYVLHLVVHRILKREVFAGMQPFRVLGVVVPVQLVYLATAVAVTTLLALASWHLFEKHFLKLKSRFEYGRPRQPAPVVVAVEARPA